MLLPSVLPLRPAPSSSPSTPPEVPPCSAPPLTPRLSLPNPPQLLAVTVLTSMDAAQLAAIGVTAAPAEQVQRLAALAADSGINGLVASAEEVAILRSLYPKATLVIPGIRPAGAAIGDQKRVATPAAALAAGASYLVIGRPITQAADPVAATQAILAEMASVPAKS